MLRVCQKTRLCTFNQVGLCNRGSDCTFAHGKDELRPVPDLFKTKLCPAVMRRERCQDPMCTYAHDKTELRRTVKASEQSKYEAQAHAAVEPPELLQPGQRAPMPGEWQAQDAMHAMSAKADKQRAKAERQRVKKQFAAQFSPAGVGFDAAGLQAAGVTGAAGPHGLAPGGASAGLSRWLPPPPLPLAGAPGVGPAAAQPQAPAPGQVSQAQDAAASPAGPTSASASQLKNKFHKTKMCYYFMHGLCNKKRSRCSFAHSEQEMRPLPDLFCTKLCPKTLEGEPCWDLDCKFAHSEEELRNEEKEHENTMEQIEQPSRASQASQPPDLDFGNIAWVRHRTDPVVPSRATPEMSVKNTFITIPEDEAEPTQRPLRRTKSLPTLSPAADGSKSPGSRPGSPRTGRAATLQDRQTEHPLTAPPSPESPAEQADTLLGFGDSIRWSHDETLNPWAYPMVAESGYDIHVRPEGRQYGEPSYQQLHAAWPPPPIEPSNLLGCATVDCRGPYGGGVAGLAEWQASIRVDMDADCAMAWAPAQAPLRGGLDVEFGPQTGA